MKLDTVDADAVDYVDVDCTGNSPEALACGEEVTPLLLHEPPPRLSPSGASTFTQCPRRWKYKYIDRLADPPGEDALTGTFAHRVLELLLQRPPEQRTLDEARIIARAEWPETEELSDYQALGHDEQQSREFRWKAWLAIEGLWHLEDPSKVEVRATELDVETELAGVPFRGIVDRIETESDGIVVSDYKSGKAPSRRFSRPRLDQVLLYAAAVEATTGEMPVRARLLYLGQRTVGIDVNREEIDTVTQRLASTWAEILTACTDDVFEPQTGPLCAWCSFVSACPQGTAEVEKRANANNEQSVELLACAS